MAFLKLTNIGKIYVSEGNVSVGIRGVNLSFDLGEFVAITGASGSGKSTLLNVLSGMDSYEEGELLIEGSPTSHYLQPDWEEYRQKYISFIFQDYNIIDSFTVLQNVELALMTIPDPVARRKRAVELIERVGLRSHMKHKGSQLSGGQKQRTVIARALAKDSPIILADEPTGNLDSETSKEIVELLREVSKDKLLIMVTHNFEQVEDVATRHVRIFDGAVESDRVLIKTKPVERETGPETKKRNERAENLSNGFLLGRSIFCSKPQLSTFLCLLMLFGSFAVFFATTFCGDFTKMFRSFYLFRREPGRLVVVHTEDRSFTDEECDKLMSETGAERISRLDYMYDISVDDPARLPMARLEEVTREDAGKYVCLPVSDVGSLSLGRYPEAKDEVLLCLPVYFKPQFGTDAIETTELDFFGYYYKVVGIKYYADAEKEATALFTDEGLELATVIYGLYEGVSVKGNCIADGTAVPFTLPEEYSSFWFVVSTEIPADSIYIDNELINMSIDQCREFSITLSAKARYARGNRSEGDYETMERYEDLFSVGEKEDLTETVFTKDRIVTKKGDFRVAAMKRRLTILIGEDVAKHLMEKAVEGEYNQISLFFKSDRAAAKAAKILNGNGYVALTTKETYRPGFMAMIELVLECFLLGVVWFLIVTFIAFFVNLCSHKTVEAFRDDLTIMRSMGIPVKVIRIGIYVRMFLALVPSFILIPVVAYIIYHIPTWNMRLYYITPWHYVFLYLGMIFITLRVTKKQIKNLFAGSVKKSLKGGEDA